MPKKNKVETEQSRRVTQAMPWLALAALALGIAAIALSYSGVGGLRVKPSASPTSTTSDNATDTPTTPVVDAGVTWKDEPQALGDLKLIEYTDEMESLGMTEENIDYFAVGNDNGQDIVVARALPDGPSGGSYFIYYFLKMSDSQYALTSSSDDVAAKSTDDTTKGAVTATDKVVKSTTKTYKSLAYQKTLTVKGVSITSTSGSSFWFSDTKPTTGAETGHKSTLTKFVDTAYGPLYTYVSSHDGMLTSRQYYILKRPDGTAAYYQLKPNFLTQDDYVPQVTWNDGTVNKDTYRADASGGCGSIAGLSVIDSSNMSDLKAAGKTKAGETVYEFSNKNNKVLQSTYQKYVQTGKDSNPPINPTIEEYLAGHALFVYKDRLDRLIFFEGGKFGPLVECGKPVIYLYPTKTTEVSVKVGAAITVSEPDYGTGWHVTAQPNGQLTNKDGKVYDSLFWEGQGQEYPNITEGFVVARKDIESTLRQHLTKLGLNTKESDDFMEFWLPKMPTTPYTRLTWFGTRQMDMLAPLTVTPKPDTTIRIFLDFEGLQQPISIPAQRLSAIPRKGFTLVEWGGLLKK